MTSLKFVLYLTYLFLGKIAQTTGLKLSSSVGQDSGFLSLITGENLTLQCFHKVDVPAKYYWYKKTLGQKPRLIATFHKYDESHIFYGEFKHNPRFTLETENSKNGLTITDLGTSDSATYSCISGYLNTVEILESVTVIVTASGLNVQTLVRQSESESVQPGDSVTLNCTVHTGTCDGEHSVYWFKNSEESHPGLIYTHGGRSDQCQRKPNTQTHTCVYNLQMQNLDLSHAGTYYCAVVSCGHILFGNGTKLDFEDEVDYFCSGSLAFTTILVVLLAFSVCMMIKRNRCQSSESQARRSAPSTGNAEDYQNVVNLYRAASLVSLHKRSRSLRDPTWSECVYYSVKQ